MTKAEFYVDFLSTDGYRPTLDDDGDVLFRFEGGTYLIYAIEDDPGYLRVLYPNFWVIESEAERASAFHAASHATRVCKGAKVFVREDGGNVCIAYECFFGDMDALTEDIPALFSRILSAMRHAAGTFSSTMTGRDDSA